MRDYRIACATYNGKLVSGQVQDVLSDSSEHLSAWLAPSLAHPAPPRSKNDVPWNDRSGANEGAPDLVAVGFQEIIPLHLALAGLTRHALDLHDDKLRTAIESLYASTGEDGIVRYSLVGRRAIGGIALLVYARDDTVATRVKDVQVNTVGCGVIGLLGNKGAVAIRVTLEEDGADGKADSSWTFVTAHLAAHQGENQARRNDWRNIVQRLVLADGSREAQIYETGHLFVFGDLNYRISLDSPSKLDRTALMRDLTQLAADSDEAQPPSQLLAQDQLRQEQKKGVTLHHLREGDIAFPPTYKYRPGSRHEFSPKRVPGWCDRVLYASAAEDDVKVLSYKSVMEFTRSDHKPVAAQFLVPAAAVASRLAASAPFAIDLSWRSKQLIGLALDRSIGAVWCLVMLAGFNRDLRLGIVNISILVLTILYGRHRFL